MSTNKKHKSDVLRVCENCGEEFYTRLAYIKRGDSCRFCSCSCLNKFRRDRPLRYIDSAGYYVVKRGGKQIREHRAVVEDSLGRKLATSEHVHHINGNKKDNRLENLKVVEPTKHHRIHGEAYRKENGRTIKCNNCGKEKFFLPCYVNHRHGGDWAKMERDYLCRDCYYKSKRWVIRPIK